MSAAFTVLLDTRSMLQTLFCHNTRAEGKKEEEEKKQQAWFPTLYGSSPSRTVRASFSQVSLEWSVCTQSLNMKGRFTHEKGKK